MLQKEAIVKLLKGIKVLDLSRLIPGPMLTMLLADLGADVIKVEEKSAADYLRFGREPDKWGGSIPLFLWINRNKRDISLDLNAPGGRQILLDMAKSCHVVVEGARPGVEAKLGLGYEDMKAVNPSIIYCSITGFGQDGPFAQLATHGGAYDAVAGLAIPYQTKDGNYVQFRPSDATIAALGQEVLPVLNDGEEGWKDPNVDISAKYCYYKTKDDRFMLIQAIERQFWFRFCAVIGRPDLENRGDWSISRMDSGSGDEELRQELINIFATKTQDEWTKIFIENNIAGAPYYPLDELAESDLFKARQMFVDQDSRKYGTIKAVASPVKVKGDDFEISRPTPYKGEHTDEILAEFGFSQQKVAELRERGAID
jgi:crotonobetainyl-CoA:carnitine CoA-transferase CaiB-like acyl-CoA transferase